MDKQAQILQAVNLSAADAADFVQKHTAYLESLNPAQYAAVTKSLPSWEDAAATLGPDVTANDLLDFVRARGGPADAAGALCFLGCVQPQKKY